MRPLSPYRPPGPRRAARRAALALLLLGAAACAGFEQIQYFAATDPETGVTNYYRMRIRGGSGVLADYRMQAGYFSAAAVDVLRGSMPDVPELDLPIDQVEVFDRLTQQFFAALIQEAKRLHPITDPEALSVAAASRQTAAERQKQRLESDLERAKAREEMLEEHRDGARTRRDDASAQTLTAAATLLGAEERKDEADKELRTAEADADQKGEAASQARREAESASVDAEKAREAFEAIPEANEEPKAKAKEALDEARTREAEQKELRKTAEKELTEAEERANTARSRRREAADALGSAREPAQRLDRELDRAARELDRREGDLVRAVEHRAAVEGQIAVQVAAVKAAEAMQKRLADVAAGAPGTALEPQNPLTDAETLQLARLVWLGSLSPSDLASVGMLQTLEPFKFRKLVFWTASSAIDLKEYATEVDQVLDQAVSIAQQGRSLAEQEKSRLAALKELAERAFPGDAEAINALLEAANPKTPAEAKQ